VSIIIKGKMWESCNDQDRNRITKSFSSKKYGYDEACTLALNERARMIRSLPHYVEALQLNVDDQ